MRKDMPFFAGSVGVIAGVLAARSVLKFGSAVAAIEARRVGDTRAVGGLGLRMDGAADVGP
jgi:hypothetical protein